jgi:hypothetical protein
MCAVAVVGLYLGCLVGLLQAEASYIHEMFIENGVYVFGSASHALLVINGLGLAIFLWVMVGLIAMAVLGAKSIGHGFFRKL